MTRKEIESHTKKCCGDFTSIIKDCQSKITERGNELLSELGLSGTVSCKWGTTTKKGVIFTVPDFETSWPTFNFHPYKVDGSLSETFKAFRLNELADISPVDEIVIVYDIEWESTGDFPDEITISGDDLSEMREDMDVLSLHSEIGACDGWISDFLYDTTGAHPSTFRTKVEMV